MSTGIDRPARHSERSGVLEDHKVVLVRRPRNVGREIVERQVGRHTRCRQRPVSLESLSRIQDIGLRSLRRFDCEVGGECSRRNVDCHG